MGHGFATAGFQLQPIRPVPEEVALELDALVEPVALVLLAETDAVAVLDVVPSPPAPPLPLPLVPPVNEKACPHPATKTAASAKVLRVAARLEGIRWFIEGGAPA
jgi:hypothetical protein